MGALDVVAWFCSEFLTDSVCWRPLLARNIVGALPLRRVAPPLTS